VGIPAGREESLFTPFYQAAAANTRQFGGVGLGLYIVRQLVEAQGGSVTASPRPGGGAVLRFTVPVAAGATVAERPGTAARPA
jgi:signal transduction histidine kinase